MFICPLAFTTGGYLQSWFPWLSCRSVYYSDIRLTHRHKHTHNVYPIDRRTRKHVLAHYGKNNTSVWMNQDTLSQLFTHTEHTHTVTHIHILTHKHTHLGGQEPRLPDKHTKYASAFTSVQLSVCCFSTSKHATGNSFVCVDIWNLVSPSGYKRARRRKWEKWIWSLFILCNLLLLCKYQDFFVYLLFI